MIKLLLFSEFNLRGATIIFQLLLVLLLLNLLQIALPLKFSQLFSLNKFLLLLFYPLDYALRDRLGGFLLSCLTEPFQRVLSGLLSSQQYPLSKILKVICTISEDAAFFQVRFGLKEYRMNISFIVW